jgi:glycerate kinase
MRILVCPDKFAGTMSASEAANSIATGWRNFAPETLVTVIPISDGGTGFLDAISTALHLKSEPLLVRGPTGQEVLSEFAFDRNTAYIEAAQAIGIHLVKPTSENVLNSSSYGLGQLVKYCIEKGFKKIIIGLGGTATSDGGAGTLAALGAKAFDAKGNQTNALEEGAGNLLEVSKIDLTSVAALLDGVTIEVLTDVDNPLLGARGAAKTYSAQKGASDEQIEIIENHLEHFSQLLGKREDGKNPAIALGAGAAGGLGFSLIRIGATRSAGIDRVISILGLQHAITKADLVITGEGKFDWQSLDGKAITGVARTALNLGKATIVIAGQVEVGRRDWQTIGVAGAFSMSEFSTLEDAISDPTGTLSRLSERVARTWNR